MESYPVWGGMFKQRTNAPFTESKGKPTNAVSENLRFLRCRFCNAIWRKKIAFENFSTVYMDKRTLRSKIWRAQTFETSWDFANYNAQQLQALNLIIAKVNSVCLLLSMFFLNKGSPSEGWEFLAIEFSEHNQSPKLRTTCPRGRYLQLIRWTCTCYLHTDDIFLDMGFLGSNWFQLHQNVLIFH